MFSPKFTRRGVWSSGCSPGLAFHGSQMNVHVSEKTLTTVRWSMELVQPHSRDRILARLPTIEVEGCMSLCGGALTYVCDGIRHIERCVPSRRIQTVRLGVRNVLGPVCHWGDSLCLGAWMIVTVTPNFPTALHGISSASESTPGHGFYMKSCHFPRSASWKLSRLLYFELTNGLAAVESLNSV